MTVKFIPHLNVYSLNLVHLSGISEHLHWRDLKVAIGRDAGEVGFVETFEAWFMKRIGHAIIDFRDASGCDAFLHKLPPAWFRLHFHAVPQVEGVVKSLSDRQAFFDGVKRETGIDLLKSEGQPPKRWYSEKTSYTTERVHRNKSRLRSDSRPPMSRYSGITRRSHYDNNSDLGLDIQPLNLVGVPDDDDQSGRERYIVVENLPSDCTADELKTIFGFPESLSIEVFKGWQGSSLLGVVKYADEGKAQLGEMLSRGMKLHGKELKTRLSSTKPSRDDLPTSKHGETTQVSPPPILQSDSQTEESDEAGKKSAHPRVRWEITSQGEADDGGDEMEEFFTL